jgi:GxxExxY protein
VGTDEVTHAIIGAALAVHRSLGAGLLESTYEACLGHEFSRRGLGFSRQVALPIEYQGLSIPAAYRVDFLVEDRVIVELKSLAALDRVHYAQLLTYLKHSGCTAGLLINFNVVLLKQGIHRMVLNHRERPRRPA